MNGVNGWVLAVVLVAAVVPTAVAAWVTPRSRVLTGLAAGLLGVAALVAVTLADPVDSPAARTLVLVVVGLVAVVGGGPVTTTVFGLVDGSPAPTARSLVGAGEVLRGGAWIGALERLAVFVVLVASWPQGLALVLAVKGLGRYPELRAREASGAAERFIIGTLTSVLWAAACAGVALALTTR